MEFDRTAMIGAGAFLAGAAITYAIGSSGRAELEAQIRQQGDVLASVSELDGRVAEIQGRIDGVVASVEVMAASEGAQSETLTGRIQALGSTLEESVGSVGTMVSEAVARDLQEIQAAMSRLAERPAAAAATAAAGGSGAAAATEDGTGEAPGPGAGEELGIGQTTSFGDGALRVFLSSVRPEEGTARVAVNGVEASTLALGDPLRSGECSLSLTGFVPGGATLDGSCGLGAGADPDAAAAVPAAPEGSGSEIAVGQTASLADGALRVFLSAADPDAGTARLAINGVTTTAVSLGEAVAADGCAVTLTGFAADGAMVAGSCGDAAPEGADAAGADAGGEAGAEVAAASGAGSEIPIGGTGSFADGSVRIFLSAVDPDAGIARVAINGTSTAALSVGDAVPAGDCTARLTAAGAGTATIDVAC